jgi:hypothetical protein
MSLAATHSKKYCLLGELNYMSGILSPLFKREFFLFNHNIIIIGDKRPNFFLSLFNFIYFLIENAY